MRSSRIILLSAVLVLLAVSVGACGSSESSDDDTEAAPASSEARCGVNQDDGSFDDVACTEPHDGQFVGVVAGPGEVPEPVEVAGSDGSEVYTDFALVTACAEPVSELIGGSLDTFGIDVAYVTASEPGEDYEDEVECWAWSRAEGALSRSIADDGLAAALGDNAAIGSLAAGDCFRFTDPEGDSFDIVAPTECDEEDTEVVEIIGVVELGDGDYPGDDAVSDAVDEGCTALEADADTEIDPSTVSFIYPTERSWEGLGQTSAICVIDRSFAEEQASERFCLTVPEGETQGIDTDCDEPHNAEFVGRGEPPADALPDDQVGLDVAIARICRPVAAAAMGLAVLPEYLDTGNPPSATLGATLTEPFDCFVKMEPDDVLTGSVFDTDPAELLGAYVATVEIEPGDCFLLVEANFSVSLPADCSEPDALMAIGSFQADDDRGYPGEDALRDIRSEECATILADSGLDVDPTTISGVIPTEGQWDGADVRTVTCDGAPT